MKHLKPFNTERYSDLSSLSIKTLCSLVIALVFATATMAQSDDCATSVDLGTIPGNGGILCQNGTTVGATPTFPPFGINGCFGGNIPQNIPDVWYQFTASENTIEVNVNSLGNVINNPAITLWQDACITGTILDCGVGAGNDVFMLFTGLIIGNTYWLLISGTGPDGFGDFEICIESNDINTCAQDQTVSVNPPPVSGVYLSDFLVEICISVDQPFVQNGADWFHGMVPSFGSGWNAASINPTQVANSCSGSGTWGWYTSVTGTNGNPQNPGTVGPGFFYETSAGGPPTDGIPGNNFGDNCSGGTASWDFCFTVRTNDAASCIEGDDLTIQWVNYSDSETGSWGSSSICPGDPELAVQATLTCCPPPDVVVNQLGCGGTTVASIEVTGVGIGPFQYTWNTGFIDNQPLGSPSIISGLTPGVYWVFAEDLGDGCTTQRSFTIDPPSDLTVDAGATQSVCSGDPVTMASVVTGGNPSYAYAWTSTPPGFTSNLPNPTFTPITANTTFQLEVTDLSLCSEVDDVIVTIDACGTPIGATFTQVNVLCFGESTGSIDVTPTGGVSPLIYSWDTGQMTQDLTNIPAGNYTLTITDDIGQVQVIPVIITQPASAMTVVENPTPTACGACDGIIDLTPSGGTPGYQYSLNGGAFTNTNTYNALCPGLYTVVVRDANLCEETFNYDFNSTAMGVTSLTGSVINCFGELGQIIAVGSGGVAPYEYSLDGGPFQSSGTFVGVPAGPHTITTQDVLGCQDVQGTTLIEPAQLVLGTVDITDNLCFNDLAGAVTINLSGGVTPYEYSLDGGTFQSSNTFTNLPGGTYAIDVQDDNGCILPTIPVVIDEPTAMTVVENPTPTACGACDGIIDLTPSGGTPGYQYSLNGGAFTNTNTYNALCPGLYTVVVRDANLCEETFNYDFNSTAMGVTSLTGSVINCFGELGQIIAVGSGGVAPYEYSLDGGPFQSSGTFVSVPAGPHTITTQDVLGCQDVQGTTLIEPAQLVLGTVDITDNLCFNDLAGAVTINLSGGVSPYEYSLDGGTFQSSNTFTNLPGGTYAIDVQDDNGCILPTIPVVIDEPTAIMVVEAITNTSCGLCDGEIDLSASGGTPGYEFSLNGGAFQTGGVFSGLCPNNYTVVMRDANLCEQTFNYDFNSLAVTSSIVVDEINCFGELGQITVSGAGGVAPLSYSLDGGTFQSSGTFNNVTSGPHNVIVQDVNGCQSFESAVLIEPSELLVDLISANNLACNNDNSGSINVNGNGGVAPYQYSLNGTNYQNSGVFNGLSANLYTVYIKDGNDCVSTLDQNITEPAVFEIQQLETTHVLCNGENTGTIVISGQGGTAPYQYSLNGGSFVNLGEFTSLTAGNYSLIVRDQNLCEFSANTTIDEPSELKLLVGATVDVQCNNGSNGSITVNGIDGTPPYLYSIDNGPFVTSNVFNGLVKGVYDIRIKDSNDCVDLRSITIDEPSAFVQFGMNITNATCYGTLNGRIQLIMEGGVTPYEYQLNNGPSQANNVFLGLAAGTYVVRATDSNGCEFETTVQVDAPDELKEDNVIINNATCNGDQNGSITITGQGGTPPYEYALNVSNQFQTSNLFENLPVRDHSIRIRDANGCMYLYEFEITEPEPLPALTFENLDNSYCDNEAAFLIEYAPFDAVIAGSGVDGSGVFNPSSLAPGMYEIKLVYTHPVTSCVGEGIKIIEILPTTEADFAGLDDQYCYDNPEVELIGIPQGGSFSGPGISNNLFDALQAEVAGTYEIEYTYTNEFGCVDSEIKEVEVSGPKFQIEEEIDVNYGDSVMLAPVLNFDWNVTGIEFLWEPSDYLSCTNCANPVVTPDKDVIYTVTAIDANGCSQTQIIRINAVKDFRVFVPSAFSPNNDGRNDILIFRGNQLVSKVNYFRVFDRWGQMVFEAVDFLPNDEDFGWDGRFNGEELNGGSFVYYTEFVFIDGTVQTKSGSVILLK